MHIFYKCQWSPQEIYNRSSSTWSTAVGAVRVVPTRSFPADRSNKRKSLKKISDPTLNVSFFGEGCTKTLYSWNVSRFIWVHQMILPLLMEDYSFFASLRVRIQFNWIRDTKWCTRTPRVTNVSHYFLPIWGCYLTGLSSWDWWTDFHPVASGLCERTDHALRWVCFFFLSDDGSADPPGVRLSLCLNKNLGFSTLRFSCVSKKLWHWFI